MYLPHERDPKTWHVQGQFLHSPISNIPRQQRLRLSDKGGGGGALVTPGGGQDTDGLVVAGQTVDTGLDQNQAELGVLVLAVTLKVLADSDGLSIEISLDQSGKRNGLHVERHTFLIRK